MSTNTFVYTFDVTTREYIYFYERDPNTRTHIGDDRTFDEPLSPKPGFTQVRDADNAAWSYIQDHRGKKQYSILDGAESKVDYLGPIKIGYTLSSSLSEAQVAPAILANEVDTVDETVTDPNDDHEQDSVDSGVIGRTFAALKRGFGIQDA